MKQLALIVVLAGTARADGAFCEVTPCDPRPVTRRTLVNDELIGHLWCKRGTEVGVDAQHRLVFCTTARALDIDGLRIATDAYTLVRATGHIYQTTLRDPREPLFADHSTVRCAAALIAMSEDGHVTYCKLAAPRPGSPRARVGDGIEFHVDGTVAAMTLDEPFTFAGLALPAGAVVAWDASGRPSGGTLNSLLRVGALPIAGEFTLYPSGKLHSVSLAELTAVAGHAFPSRAQLELREDSSLVAARYVTARGFMIHGEEWTDTTEASYDAKGHVVTTHTTHFQSN